MVALWCFLAPNLHGKGPALAPHLELLYINSKPNAEDPCWRGIPGAEFICKLMLGTKLYLNAIGPYFPIWIQYYAKTSEILAEHKVEDIPW